MLIHSYHPQYHKETNLPELRWHPSVSLCRGLHQEWAATHTNNTLHYNFKKQNKKQWCYRFQSESNALWNTERNPRMQAAKAASILVNEQDVLGCQWLALKTECRCLWPTQTHRNVSIQTQRNHFPCFTEWSSSSKTGTHMRAHTHTHTHTHMHTHTRTHMVFILKKILQK